MANIKLTELAKDLGLKNKDIVDLFSEKGVSVKSSSNLEANQLDLFFESLTKKNQIKDIDAYIDGDTYIPSKKKAVEKAEKKAENNVEAKPEVKVEEKAEAKTEQKSAEAKPQNTAQRPLNARDTQVQKPKQGQAPTYQQGQKPPYGQGQKPAYGQGQRPQFQNNMQKPPFQSRDGQSRSYQSRESSFISRQQQNQPIFTKDGFINVTPQNNQRPGYGGKSAQKRPGQRPQNGNDFGFGKDKDEGYQNAPKEHFKPTAIVRGQTAKGEVSKKEKQTRVIDMRDSNVDLSKYDDRLDNFVPDAVKDVRGGNQKLKKQNNQNEKYKKDFKKEAPKVVKKQPVSILVPDEISVGELASRLKVTAGEVVKKLMLMGVMATVNQIIDYDTAYLIADELGAICNKEVVVSIEDKLFDEQEDTAENLETRAPVVCVMGHVDHGKTSLLDAIRNTSVTTGEAGGITQHIGAYRVNINGKDITFLDTPGHEAFTAMRARGAKATDIAILVVAGDDGIMPQTVEAINHAKAAGIDIIVAINKMDKPTANPDAIKQELTKYDLVPEEWGGDVICVPVSAKTHKGIDELLESVLLVAEVKDLKANPNRRAKGIVIEAKLDKGRGPVATVLVQNGTLHSGDIVIAGTAVGKVRVMTDHNGKVQKVAGPSVPVEIVGLADVPMSGDEFNAVEDERMARELAEQRRSKAKEEEFKLNARANLNDLFTQISEGVKDLNVIVKADVMGSAEAVKASLEKISNDEVKVRVIHSAVGGITEGDVMLATASNAIIVGFNVRPDKSATDSAERQKVEIRTYRVIYECIDEITSAMKGMLAPKFKETVLGHAEVRQTIHVPSVGTIAGSYILDGKVTRQSQIRVVRDGIVIFEDKISSLKRFKDDAKEVAEGYECGIGLEKFNDIKLNDILEAFIMEEIQQ